MEIAKLKDKLKLNKEVAPYVFIAPFFILFFIFHLFPIAFSLVLSFSSWDGIGQMNFVGLDNFAYVLTDAWFWDSVRNTVVIFIMTTIPQHVIGLAGAFVLNSDAVRFRDFFRSSYFLPYITSAAAIAVIFEALLAHRSGLLNYILQFLETIPPIGVLFEALKIDLPINWLSKARTIWASVAGLVTWRFTGFNLLVYYAGIQNIPKQLYEAAKIDGASKMQIFTKITFPLLKPVVFFAMTMSVIGNLQLFQEPFILLGANGGTGRYGMTTAMYLYRTGFHWRQFGEGSAIAYILCAAIIILTIVNKKLFGGGGARDL